MRPRIQRQRRRPNRIPLPTDIDLTQRPTTRLIPIQPIDDPPGRSFTTTVRHPPAFDGRTQASTVIPDNKSSDAESATVTQSFTPSKLNADPNRPDALHTAPDTTPPFPRPDHQPHSSPNSHSTHTPPPSRMRRRWAAARDGRREPGPRAS